MRQGRGRRWRQMVMIVVGVDMVDDGSVELLGRVKVIAVLMGRGRRQRRGLVLLIREMI